MTEDNESSVFGSGDQEGGQPYLEIIARLGAAAVGCPQLDWAIHGAPAPPPPAYGWANIPRYTTSLDDALLLVPEGWHFQRLERSRDCFSAEIESRDGMESWYGNHPNMVIALCIACLRAKPATVASDNGTPPKTDETNGGTP